MFISLQQRMHVQCVGIHLGPCLVLLLRVFTTMLEMNCERSLTEKDLKVTYREIQTPLLDNTNELTWVCMPQELK